MSEKASFRFSLEQKLIALPDLKIELIPAFYLERYLSQEDFVLLCKEDLKENIIRIVKNWVYKVKSSSSSFPIEKLKSLYFSTYCALNFVSSSLNITGELRETREAFLKAAAHEPYLMVKERKNIALDLYHREPLENSPDLIKRLEKKNILNIGLEDISLEEPEEFSISANSLEKRIVNFAKAAYAEINKREQTEPVSSQLRFFVNCMVYPKMFGISLERYGMKDVKEVYAASAEKYGDFEIPMPRIFLENES
uniref:Uncharacterized protein n=1 Tax=Thermodesulfobacterium geofontis TaxID=1295609 RepID=A0A7V5K1H2_9BACT